MEAIDYFTGSGSYFITVARHLGTFICLLSIIWNCIQIAFSTMETRKFLVGTITKTCLFIFILNTYTFATRSLEHFALSLGKGGSAVSMQAIAGQLKSYMTQLESTLDQDQYAVIEKGAATVSGAMYNIGNYQDKVEAQKRENYLNDNADVGATSAVVTGGKFVGQQRKAMKKAEESISKAREVIAYRDEHPDSQRRTIAAIKNVLKPVDDKGKRISGSYAKDYILDLDLKDSQGNSSGYLSPNLILKMSTLAAQIIWEKQFMPLEDSSTDETKTDTDSGFHPIAKFMEVSKVAVNKLFELILSGICVLGMVIAVVCADLQYVMCIIEWAITSSFAIVLVPCILFDGTKDIANKVLPTLLAQAAKLTMITMTLFFGVYAILNVAMEMIGEGGEFSLITFAYIMFTVLLAWALSANGPKIAVTLLTGQPQLSMGEFVQVAGSAAAGAGAGYKYGSMAARTAAGAIKQGVPAAARGTMNGLGNAASMLGAGMSASQSAGGGGKGFMVGLGAAGRERMSQAGQGFTSRFTGAMHSGMQGGGMGGGGSGGNGSNRWDHMDGVMFKQTGTDSNGYPTGHNNSMSYGSAVKYEMNAVTKQYEQKAMTGTEFLKSRFSYGQDKYKGAENTAGMFAAAPNIPAQSSYAGLDYNPPLMLPAPPDSNA